MKKIIFSILFDGRLEIIISPFCPKFVSFCSCIRARSTECTCSIQSSLFWCQKVSLFHQARSKQAAAPVRVDFLSPPLTPCITHTQYHPFTKTIRHCLVGVGGLFWFEVDFYISVALGLYFFQVLADCCIGVQSKFDKSNVSVVLLPPHLLFWVPFGPYSTLVLSIVPVGCYFWSHWV